MYRSSDMEPTKTLYNLLHEEIHKLNNVDVYSENEVSNIHELILKKTDCVAGYLEHLDDQFELVCSKIKKLTELKHAIKSRVEKFESYIQNCIELNSGPINGSTSVLKLATNPPSVEILDLDQVDVRFIEIKQEVVVNKKDILDNFKKTGEIPSGINIVQKKRIKIGDRL